METITLNTLKGKPQRVVEGGVEYLVCDATSIVPGVLNGSKGALLYPVPHIVKSVPHWDGMPLTLDHPYDEYGRPVNAGAPGVLARQGLGRIRNTTSTPDGRLRHKCWFDVQAVKRLSPELYDKIVAGQPVEVSTGLHTVNIPAPPGATFNGRPYQFIATNYIPDHLAILVDQRGACSVSDGCGVHNKDRELVLNRPDKKFHRPENYEKINDLPGDKELWAGANDWESGWTWAGIYPKGDDAGYKSTPEKWIEIDHSKCPGCKGTLDASSRTDGKACQEYGKGQVEEWIKSPSAATPVENEKKKVKDEETDSEDEVEDEVDEDSIVQDDVEEAVENLDYAAAPPVPGVSVGEFFITLLHAATSSHILHLQTRSFAQHAALGELYKSLPDLVDGIIEAYQGVYGIIGDYPAGYIPPSLADSPEQFVRGLLSYVETYRTVVGSRSELQNMVDEVVTLLDSTLYKLRFLS